MATMRKAKKKATKKKATKKKATKKKVKKKVSKKLDLKASLSKAQITRCENNTKNGMLAKMQLLTGLKNRFQVGDVINHGYPGYGRNRNNMEFDTYHWEGEQTEIRQKYRIAYIDSEGFPHAQAIRADGSFDSWTMSLLEQCEERIWDYDDDVVNYEGMFPLDDDFLDATLLEDGVYDPLYDFKKIEADKEKEQEERNKKKVLAYNEAVEANSKLLIPTTKVAGRKAFKEAMKVGKHVYVDFLGKLTVTIKNDDIIIFADSDMNLKAYSDNDIKKTKFYKSAPKIVPYVHKALLKKYAPKVEEK